MTNHPWRFSRRRAWRRTLTASPEKERGLGSGLGSIEGGLRLRYELHRKFAPHAGYVWEHSFASTADRLRAGNESATEHRFVAGFRMWW